MSNEAIVEQIRSANEADRKQLYEDLYEQNRGLIFTICRKYSAYECMEDLMQEAFFGLRIAVDLFDADQGSFSTYATAWIKQAVIMYVENCGSSIRIPRYVRGKVITYKKLISQYEAQFGQAPTDAQIMKLLKIDRKQLMKLKENVIKISIRSLDEVISENDDSFTLGDTIADPKDHYEELIVHEDQAALAILLWQIVNELTPIEAKVIKKRFRDNLTLRDVGNELGITAENVRRCQEKALRKLRSNRQLESYRDEFISARAYKGTGLNSFRHTGSSQPERIALECYEESVERYLRNLDEQLARIEKKYGIKVDDAYRQKKIDEFKEIVKR